MIKRSIAVIASLFFAFPVVAQEEDAIAEIRQFNVEVIVFAYAEEVSVGTEIFVPDAPPEPEPIEFSDVLGLGDQQLVNQDEIADEITEKAVEETDIPSFSLQTESELQMQDIANRMRRLDVYDVLLHAGWTQSGTEKDTAITMQLDMLAPVPPGLSGEFTMYLSRFLHLVADLELAADNQTRLPVAIETPSDLSNDEYARRAGPVIYRIREDRIFRSDETRYFDHPKFGVIARITRYEEPDLEEPIEVLPGSAAPASSN